MARHRTRLEQRILTAVCLSASAAVIVCLAANGRKTFSDDENRSLAEFPSFSWTDVQSGKYFTEINDWFSDQFPLRAVWKRVDFTGQYMLGYREFSGVYTGRDGYLLSEPAALNQDAMTASAEAVNSFAESHSDLTVSMLVVPDATSILTDKLPAGAAAGEQRTQIGAYESQLDDSIQMIDAGAVLSAKAAEEDGDQIYYRTDHHWTTDGAYAVFLAAAPSLGIDSPAEYQSYVISNRFQGTLASRSGDHRSYDEIKTYAPVDSDVAYYVNDPSTQTKSPSVYDKDMLDTRDQYAVFFGGNHAVTEILTTADTDRRLLVFKDSYANCFVPFLIPYYSEIVMIDPRYYYDNLETSMTSYGFTDVLFLYSADTLFQDTSLKDTLESGNQSG